MEKYSDLRDFMEADHKRLDALLDRALSVGERIDFDSYNQFRQGLLKHIGIEEKILLPLAQRLRNGTPLPQAAKLRLDHGALASLLVPPPTGGIIRAIRTVLQAHNPLEEGSGGVYEQCKELAGAEADAVLAELLAVNEVPIAARKVTDKVIEGIRRALVRAGFSDTLIDN